MEEGDGQVQGRCDHGVEDVVTIIEEDEDCDAHRNVEPDPVAQPRNRLTANQIRRSQPTKESIMENVQRMDSCYDAVLKVS